MGRKAKPAKVQYVDGALRVFYPDGRVEPRLCVRTNMRREFCPCAPCRVLRRWKHRASCTCWLCFTDRMGAFIDQLGRGTAARRWLWFLTLTFRTPNFPWKKGFPMEQPMPCLILCGAFTPRCLLGSAARSTARSSFLLLTNSEKSTGAFTCIAVFRGRVSSSIAGVICKRCFGAMRDLIESCPGSRMRPTTSGDTSGATRTGRIGTGTSAIGSSLFDCCLRLAAKSLPHLRCPKSPAGPTVKQWDRGTDESEQCRISATGYGRCAVCAGTLLPPEQLAELWALSPDTVRRMFEHEAGVLVIERPRIYGKRRYRTLRIPESVAQRVYHRSLLKGRPPC